MPASTPPLDLRDCRRALVIKPSSLGDIVHTLPAVHLLKRKFPDLRFTWLAHPSFAPLLEGNSDLGGGDWERGGGEGGILHFPREDFRGLAGLGRFRNWLRDLPSRVRPDVALDFQGLLRSGLTARASRAALRIGFSDSREGARLFHNVVIEVDPGAHAIERSLALPRVLGADGPLVFPLPDGQAPAALPGGTVPEGAILLHPFSRGKGKSLTVDQTRRLCQELSPLPVLLVGRSDEKLGIGLPANAINLLNVTSLPELIWLIRQSSGVISVDSGPMHIAAALTPDVLSLHTWSDPRTVGPWHPGTTVWKAGRLMRADALDPEICALKPDFPDSAIPTVAAWAHQLAARGRGGEGWLMEDG